MIDSRFLRIFLATLCLAGATAAGGEQGLSRGPIPIHDLVPQTPVETAGTGLAPEVAVKLTIDITGRVGRVEVQAIRPSSEFDDLFRRQTTEALLRWRYAPALTDGVPVETSLEVTFQFPSRQARDEERPAAGLVWREQSRGEEANADYYKKLMSMKLEQRVQHLQEQGDLARELMDAAHLKRAATPSFVVYTDAAAEGVAEALGQNLEVLFAILTKMLGQDVAPQPERYKIQVFAFATAEQFGRFRGQSRSIEFSAGLYNPAGLIALHLNMPSEDSLLGLLLHEGTHAYLDRYIVRPGTVLPRWLGEGFAEYIGNSTIKKGQMVPGKVRKVDSYRGPWGQMVGRSQVLFSVDEVKKAVKKEEALKLQEMLGASPDDFYGEKRRMYYTMSWILIHFLRHGEEAWEDDRFPALLLYVAEGYPVIDAFRLIYGDLAQLEPEFQRYVKEF